MAAPIIPLALGAGALWLLSQLGKGAPGAGAQGTQGCPSGASPRTLSNGQVLCLTPEQMQQAAGLSDAQLISALESAGIGVGANVVGGVLTLVLGIALKGGTATVVGAGSAATTTGATAITTAANAAPTVVAAGGSGATDAAETAASVFADEAAVDVAAAGEMAGLGFVGAMVAIPYILAQTTSLLAQAIGGIARNRNRADAQAPTNLDTILYNEQAAVTSFVQGIVSTLNATIQSNAQKAGATPSYPDLNKQTSLAGFRGFAGARRFGIVSRTAVSATAQATATPLMTSPILALAPALDYSKPYFETDDGYTGGHNEAGSVIAYCAGANSYCYYLTNVDARLPVKMISNYRGLMRWMFWTQERAYNATMEAYWSSRISAENGIPECTGLQAIDCVNKFVIPSGQFDAQTAAYFQSIPAAQLLPVGYQTFTTYPELNALAAGYIQSLNAAAKARPDLQIDFTKLTQSNAFNGVVQAICAAAQVGFGTAWSTWPGDQQFTNMVLAACGLDVAGWSAAQSVFVVNPQYGNAYRWLIQDPVTGWFIDVVGSRDAKTPMCYKFLPQGANLNTGPGPAVPNPVPAYVRLSGFARGGSRSRRTQHVAAYGCAVPLDPAKQSWLGEMIRRGLGQ